jgi:DNA-binding CsgD family transcriptional regulator/PAS domain-containing protein
VAVAGHCIRCCNISVFPNADRGELAKKPRPGDLASITQAFSAGATDPRLWEDAMVVAAEATGSTGAALLPLRGHLPSIPISQSVGELFEAYFRDGWHQTDPRYAGIPALIQRGAMSDFDVGPPEAFIRTPIYQELCAPLGLRWVAGVKVAAGDDLWCLAIQRSADEGPFAPQDIRRLSALSQSLSAAAATARAFGFARAEAALDAFEMSRSAVVLFDRSGEVFRLNKAAERLLGHDLQIVHNRLVSRDQSATEALDRALHSARWRPDGGALQPPVTLRREEGYPILAHVSRLSGVAADCFAPCQVTAVLIDLEQRVQLAEQDLMSVFNLTPSEARLANRLSNGHSLEEIAAGMSITYETSRKHLKNIFQKTNTHRQAQLVALLGRFSVGRGCSPV